MAITASGFFGLRTPLLPFDELVTWGADLRAATATDGELEATLADDRQLLRTRLAAMIARPEVREALFLASPNLDESLHYWASAPDGEHGKKVERTLARYVPRMAGRCTPFGLFAGCSTGTIGDHTQLAIAGRDHYRRSTRLDMDYVFALCEALARDPGVRETLVYRPNSSLYRAAGQLRYAEGHVLGKGRSYHLMGIEPTEYLVAALTCASSGARIAQLVASVVDPAAGIEPADAEAFVAELIEAQVVVPDLHPAVTGAQALDALLDVLRRNTDPISVDVTARLGQTRRWLDAHDRSALGTAPSAYREVAAQLGALPVELDLARLFQVDMHKPAPELALGRALVDEIAGVVAVLHAIAPPRGEGPLDKFETEFARRYEDREVPLVEVLDEEGGIGFDSSQASAAEASSLLERLVFPTVTEPESVPWGPRTVLRLRKIEQAIANRTREVVLDAGDLEKLTNKSPPALPRAFAVMVAIAARDLDALAAGAYRIAWLGMSGPSGANLFGRFCHGDPALTEHVLAHLRAEEALAPDAIHAEVVHLPEDRIGNILARPVLRDYEIPYLGRAGVPRERQIAIDDLMVSVREGRAVLRSKRLDREVIPRMTTAHNVSNPKNLGLYKFLCAFQARESLALGWSWGALREASFLPRVVVGRCVLSAATWRVGSTELAPLAKLHGAAVFRAVQALRAKRDLPRFVELADGDNTLPIDLDNILSVETFVHLVKARAEVTLSEIFPGPDELVARGPEGRFVHELVIPFVKTAPRPAAIARVPVTGVRTFPPGSEWLYARLFAGSGSIDHALRELAPLVRDAVASGAVDRWFFLRYDDPSSHLRLRFHGAPARLLGEVLPALELATRPLLAEGRIYRMELGTYDRELERYGGADGIAIAEQVFHADSDAALAIVELLEQGESGADARWRLAVRGMDQLLDDLGFDATGKLAVLKQCRASFGREFHVDVAFERQLGDKFRIERKPLEALLDRALDADSPFGPALEAFDARSRRLAGLARFPAIAPDLLHLHANRMLRGAHRSQELVIYDLLVRIYEGRAARARRGK